MVKTPCFIYSAALLDVLSYPSWRGAWYRQPKASKSSAVTRPVCPFDAVQCKLSELTSPGQR